MNKNTEKWIAALESGEFKQGKKALYTEEGYCCLGVACVLAEREGIVKRKDFEPDEDRDRDSDESDATPLSGWYGGGEEDIPSSLLLPYAVQKWLGLDSPAGDYFDDDLEPGQGGHTRSLSGDNDEGATFADIARTIREKPRGLFRRELT